MSGTNFDTSINNGVLGLFFTGASFAAVVAAIVLSITEPDTGPANIASIVGAVLLGLAAIFLWLNFSEVKKAGSNTQTNLPLYLLALTVILFAVAGVLINL
ncbi:MAG: hypothetical protein ACFFGZ_18885 [Candidatus Thorarchaeota archaeon]